METPAQGSIRELVLSLTRFGVVGAAAALVQATLFWLIMKNVAISGFSANTLAFAASLVVSYFGQSRWTFGDRPNRSILRFVMLALLSFAIGSAAAWLIVDRGGYSPNWMLPVILIVIPLTSFVVMRSFVFTSNRVQ
jgi:putative flippase GtrA